MAGDMAELGREILVDEQNMHDGKVARRQGKGICYCAQTINGDSTAFMQKPICQARAHDGGDACAF